MSRDSGCRPHELIRLRIRDLVFKNAGDKQYAEVILMGKTGSRSIPLIDSLPYVKDYLDHEHPHSSNLDAPLFAGTRKSLGRPIGLSYIRMTYSNYKKDLFPRLLQSANCLPPADVQRIRELLRKPWNPYIRRHSSLTQKSKYLKEHILRQHAGWSPRSQMHLKYVHYFGNESSESILQEYGILPKDNQELDLLKPKQCPNCNEPNRPDQKFCAKCRMVLTYDAYNETLESEKQKQDRLISVEERLNNTEQMINQLIAGLGKITDQQQLNVLAQSMFSSGILKAKPSLQP